MKNLKIRGLSVTARHGVFPEEKTAAQPFVFDIDIEYDASEAEISDDISRAVNYGEVCAAVDGYCRENCFNLIERLAGGAARLILDKFPPADGVEVTVHKPCAPIGLPFSDVSVTAREERNRVVLSLGASEGDKKGALDGALAALERTCGVKVLKVSDYLETEPYGGVAKNAFLNCAALIECTLSPRGLLNEIHRIEREFKRVRGVRWADRTLDIDIIFFGDKIIAEEGLCVPHPDYHNRAFVIEPLKQIAPDFVCPKRLMRVSDM